MPELTQEEIEFCKITNRIQEKIKEIKDE